MRGRPDVSKWLVSKTSRFFDTRIDRRSFIARSTMVGTAVAASGCAVITGPGRPYTYVTDCGGGLCRDGYTEFCCVINGGQNACPPGTAAAGWWRASGSAYCPGGTRFFVDCNNWSGAGPCRCADGCGTRKVYCNHFRYGQCNAHISGTGVIACRLVTCVPPYDIAELNCSPSGAVDNATANHNADCARYGQGGPPPPPPPVPVPLSPAVGSVLGAPAVSRSSGGPRTAPPRSSSRPRALARVPPAGRRSGLAATTVSSRIAIAAYGANRCSRWPRTHATGQPTWTNFDGATWSAWALLDGLIASDPVLVTQGSDVVMIVRGHDAALHFRTFDGTSWGGWSGTPEIVNSNPAAVDDGGTVLFCARGTDRAIHFNRLSGGAPTGWITIDGVITSDPVLSPNSPGAHFVARGDDGELHLHGVGGATPSGWQTLPPGGYNTEPAVASFGGELHVVVRGLDNQIWWSRRASGSWSAWQPAVRAHARPGARRSPWTTGPTWSCWCSAAIPSSGSISARAPRGADGAAVPGVSLAPTTAYF